MTKKEIDKKIFAICRYLNEQEMWGKVENGLVDEMNKLIKLRKNI